MADVGAPAPHVQPLFRYMRPLPFRALRGLLEIQLAIEFHEGQAYGVGQAPKLFVENLVEPIRVTAGWLFCRLAFVSIESPRVLNMFKGFKQARIWTIVGKCWKSRKEHKALECLAEELTKDENTIPYCSIADYSTRPPSKKDFASSDYPGLLFYEILTNDGSTRLITCWRTKEHHDNYMDNLEAELGEGKPKSTWSLIEVRRPVKPFLKRHSLAASILAVAALFGALSTIRDYFSVLFSQPQVGVSYSESKVDVVEGQPIALSLKVLNEVRFAPMKITFQSAWIQTKSGKDKHNLSFDNSVFASVSPGNSASTSIYGVAPGDNESQESPKIYEVHVKGTAKAGLLRYSVSLAPPNLEVWVWPIRSWASPLHLLKTLGTKVHVCVLGGTIYASKSYPKGAKVEIVWPAVPADVTSAYLGANGSNVKDPSFKDVGGNNQRVMQKKFTTPALKQFDQYHYQVFLYLSKPSRECMAWPAQFQVVVE